MTDLTDERTSLVGQTFLVRAGNRAVAMLVERVELGWAYCKSLDLESIGKWPTDVVNREIERQRQAT